MIAALQKETSTLTPLQRSMILSSQRTPRAGIYVIQDVCQSTRKLDLSLLKSAWQKVAQRHPALRSSIESGLHIRVYDTPEISWRELDWRGNDIAAFLQEDREQGFDFGQGVPMRFTLLHTSDDSDTLIWTSHHALLDGRSYLIVWREWFALYEGLDLPAPATFHPQPDSIDAAQYWREHLAGLSQTTGFIVDRLRRDTTISHASVKETRIFSDEVTAELWSFARRHDVTMSTLIQAAWALLLSRYSGNSDIVFGVTRTGRSKANQGSVGLLINTLPLRIAVPSDAALLPWLSQLRGQWINMRDFQHAPPDPIRDGTPLFDSVLAYDHEPPGETLRKLGGGWQHRSVTRHQRTDSPLTIAAYGNPQVHLQIIYDARLFDRRTVSAMAGHLETLLLSFLSQPGSRLSELKMLTGPEEQWLAEDVHRTTIAFPESSAHRLFEQQSQRTPDKVALEDSSGQILYSELNQRANRVAAFLRHRGARPEDLIAVCMDRSPDAVIAILAVLKAGAAFLPLDPSLPAERLATMIEDAQPKFILSKDLLDTHVEQIAHQPSCNLSEAATPANAAYAIFTSGSSGKPKAVIVTHRSLVNHTLAVRQVYNISETDRRLQFASLGSDVFVSEVFTYLTAGAALVFCVRPEGHSIKEFVRRLENHRITITGMPATWWNEWVAAASSIPPSLRAVIVGMERVDPATFLAWKKLAGNTIRWFNAYGPTETSPTATIYEAGSSEWEGGTFVPIGKPIANNQVHVLDNDGNPVPVGVAGELYIGGAGVARGYLNATFLTNGLYKTGDLGFRLPDGNLVMLGRVDRQVKIRGFRVELEEIEAVLSRHPSIRQCAVIPVLSRDHRERSLVACFTKSDGHTPTPDQLRLHLSRHLPSHMIPVSFMMLAQMPLTASGKIDYRSLPPPDSQPLCSTSDFAEPSTPIEKRLAALWRDVLRIPRLDITADFFRLGGDSLSATVLIGMIDRDFGQELSLADLAHAPTIARLASILEKGHSSQSRDDVIPFQPTGTLTPIFGISSMNDDILCFRHLVPQLGDDRPFFAMANPIGTELRTVEELASTICDRIHDIRPHGPYILAGFCFGGVVAFEAARQLMAGGDQVRMVVLFDTLTPGYPKLSKSRRRYWRQLFSADGKKFSDLTAHAGVVGRLIANKARTRMQRTSNIADPIVQSARLYIPKPIPIPIVQFIAGDQIMSTRILEDPRLGWRDLCREFHLFRLPGVHGNSFFESQAPEIAAKLKLLLTSASASIQFEASAQ